MAVPSSSQRLGRAALVVAVGLIGLGAGLLLPRLTDGAGDRASGGRPDPGLPVSTATEVPSLSPDQVPVAEDEPAAATPRGARSPQAAVAAFLEDEADGAVAEAYRHLSRRDRREFGGAAGWEAGHADLLPISGFRVTDVQQRGDVADVDTTLWLRSGLDEVSGLTPARAKGRWIAVRETGRWWVAYGRSETELVWPSDRGAPQDAAAWVRDQQACQGDSADLIGDVTLVQDLCGASGEPDVGVANALLDDSDAQPFVSAYGGEATAQLRAVPVNAPAALRVVVAPLGDRWSVVGVLREDG